MINLLQQIDFSKQLQQQRQLEAYIRQAALQIQKQNSQQLSKFIKPIFDEDLENHLIVTNIPDLKTPQKQKAFLIMFSTNVLDKKSIGEKEGLISIEPGYAQVNGQRKYNGTLYMIYKTPAIAKRAYQKLHRYKLSKDNTLNCFTVKQFRDVQKIGKQYKQPKLFLKKQLINHNMDQKFRDQFIFINKENNNSRINIKWFDYIQKKIDDVLVSEDNNNKSSIPLSEGVKNVAFSTKGNYLAVCQAQGISLLAGEKLTQKGFYFHEGVTQVMFSPNQTFMISFNKSSSKARSQQCFKLWAVQSQVLLAQYKAQPHQNLTSFQFSNDETKLAIILNNQFVVFQSNSLENLKSNIKMSQEELVNSGKLVKTPNLQKIAWLPDCVSVACVCYELNPQINAHPTSKIFTYNTQTKEQKKWKAIGQNIRNVQISISNNADWIAISFDKVQKKVTSSVIYIVNLKKRQIETEVVQFKEIVVSISWDKRNNIFAVVTELPTAHKNQDAKYAVYFYQIVTKDKIQQAVKFAEIPVTPTNRVIVAQNGTFFALYNISPLTWGKYKYSVGSFTRDPKTKKLTIDMIKENLQIPYMTYFNMDETGRFILTGTDKTFQIWTTAGQLISKDMFSTEIKYVQFRPRESIKLTQQEEAKLQQREKQIKKKYQQQDEKRMSRIKDEQKLQKERKCEQFRKYLQQKRQWFSQFRQLRTNLLGFNEEDPKVRSSVYQFQYLQRN